MIIKHCTYCGVESFFEETEQLKGELALAQLRIVELEMQLKAVTEVETLSEKFYENADIFTATIADSFAAGYRAGHEDTVESRYVDPMEKAREYTKES